MRHNELTYNLHGDDQPVACFREWFIREYIA